MSGEICTDNLLNQAGDGAPDFSAGMPTVGGDPIAESGRNSDGHWTKLADGTLLLHALFSTTSAFPLEFNGGALVFFNDIPFPMDFINTEYMLLPNGRSGTGSALVGRGQTSMFVSGTGTSTFGVTYDQGGFSSGSKYAWGYIAKGRWKA